MSTDSCKSSTTFLLIKLLLVQGQSTVLSMKQNNNMVPMNKDRAKKTKHHIQNSDAQGV